MVQGKHPLPSVILCESRESRNTVRKEWTPALRLFLKRGDDGEWATVTKVCWVTMVQGKHPSLSFPFPIPSFSAKAGNLEIQLEKKATHPPQWDGLRATLTLNNHF